ncbi:hypothetical protein [Mesorhizobium sp.]|uniref:hypothetical protein n=1 Tax=Mesorhizobium sp. TaxID=1871066 RepID=UPI0025BD97DE|nr:hypothetical protein [Mesorhizobium sp.]
MKRPEIAQQILITCSGAPPTPKIDGERLRVRPRLPHSNKHAGRSNVGRVEKTHMLYIAGYQETWMLWRWGFPKKIDRIAIMKISCINYGCQAGFA